MAWVEAVLTVRPHWILNLLPTDMWCDIDQRTLSTFSKSKPIRGIHLTPPTTRDCGLSNESNGDGSTCTACWTKR